MVKVALVGAGAIAERHINAFQKISNAKIAAVIDIDRKAAEQRAAMCDAKAYDTLADCLDIVDAVWVLTPPSFHKDISVEAMRAGKHVVVEKPISVTIEDAEIMIDEAKKNNVKLMVAFCNRFRDGYAKLQAFASSGKVGRPITYWCQRQGLLVKKNWTVNPSLMTGMSIQSLSHDIDLMRWIAGEVLDVNAIVQESRPDLPGFDDNANAIFHLADGVSGNFQSSWSSSVSFNTRGILGTNGVAYVGGKDLWNLEFFTYKTKDMDYEITEHINDLHNNQNYTHFIRENQHFVDCVDKNMEPILTGEDGLKTLKISYGILESGKTGKTIRF